MTKIWSTATSLARFLTVIVLVACLIPFALVGFVFALVIRGFKLGIVIFEELF